MKINHSTQVWAHTSILWVILLFSSSDTKSWNTKLHPNVWASVLYFCNFTNSLKKKNECSFCIICVFALINVCSNRLKQFSLLQMRVYVLMNNWMTKLIDTVKSLIINIHVSDIYFSLNLDSHLKSELVTGYLSILNVSTFTALTGDSPSRPSAAFVPILKLPPGTNVILSSAETKQI